MLIDMAFIVEWIRAGLRLSVPLVLTSAGAVYSERSGVFNVSLEGMMLAGALFAYVGAYFTDSVFLATLMAMAAGGVLALLLAFLNISRRANQLVAGLMVNLLALGLTNALYRAFLGGLPKERVRGFPVWKIPLLGDIPVLGDILFNQSIIVYAAYLVPAVATWILFHTTWGLNIRAVGENPQAAESAGLSVERIRYWSVILSGMMGGLGGAALVLANVRYFTHDMIAGRGFIVLGAIVFGRWNPALVAAACFVFGAAEALQLRFQTFDLAIPHQFFSMIPYLLTIAALTGLTGRTAAPQSLGEPYGAGDR